MFTHTGQVVHHAGRPLIGIGTQVLERLLGSGRSRILALAWDTS